MANMLYNGVELPNINTVWTDKTTYPWAFIWHSTDGYILELATAVPTYSSGNVWSVAVTRMSYALADNAWDYVATFTTEANTAVSYGDGSALWTSADILNADGTVYLAASEPVYTALHSFKLGLILSALVRGAKTNETT